MTVLSHQPKNVPCQVYPNMQSRPISAYFCRIFRDYMVRILWKKFPRFSDMPIHSFWALITRSVMHQIKQISVKSTRMGRTTQHLERRPIIGLLATDMLLCNKWKATWSKNRRRISHINFTCVKIRKREGRFIQVIRQMGRSTGR